MKVAKVKALFKAGISLTIIDPFRSSLNSPTFKKSYLRKYYINFVTNIIY